MTGVWRPGDGARGPRHRSPGLETVAERTSSTTEGHGRRATSSTTSGDGLLGHRRTRPPPPPGVGTKPIGPWWRRTGMETLISGGRDMTERGTPADFARLGAAAPDGPDALRRAPGRRRRPRRRRPGGADPRLAALVDVRRVAGYARSPGWSASWPTGAAATARRRPRRGRRAGRPRRRGAARDARPRPRARRRGAEPAAASGRRPALLRGPGRRHRAEVMDCAPGTVKATLHQARARLRDLLGDDDD